MKLIKLISRPIWAMSRNQEFGDFITIGIKGHLEAFNLVQNESENHRIP